ncbi:MULTISPECIES: GerMN domain-containing protein [Clostridium]|uniref:Sporulation and spore germination n=1 Tax=Clostridium colicanis DSM 13634 TaxID=1121305 RepID=A0A151AM61_9CLOT|nr:MULTISPECIES: GerMN domain-containing protein [Clostridium]KYH28711.1 sporulation and spore germination [Clostridium colicanis DSM 13634]MBE6044960.1 sporulation/spore germination protein [Clostridium thermopalmarium]
MKKIYKLFLIVVSTVFLSFTLLGCVNKNKELVKDNKKLKTLKLPNSDETCINLDVYFDGSKSENEVKVLKEERIIEKEELIGETIMQELIKGPSVKSQLKPVFHKDTKLISFSIKDGIAYVNLSKEAKFNMSAAKEEACLRSIVLSLTQLSSINKVKILVDNKSVDSLGGNYDISKAFSHEDISKIKK